MRNARQLLASLVLPLLATFAGCDDAEIDSLLRDLSNANFTSSYRSGTLLSPPASYAVFNIDSITYSGDSARIYSTLAIPGMNDSSAFLYDVRFNYWDELAAKPETLSHIDNINDSIHFSRDGMYHLNSSLTALTMNTSYRVCAVQARYAAASDTTTINGWWTSFWTIE